MASINSIRVRVGDGDDFGQWIPPSVVKYLLDEYDKTVEELEKIRQGDDVPKLSDGVHSPDS